MPVTKSQTRIGQTVEIGDLVDGDDAGMSELGSRPRLAVEPRDVLGGFDSGGRAGS